MRIIVLLGLMTAALPAAAQSPPARLACIGQEPFWSLSLDGNTAQLAAPNEAIVALGPEIVGQRKAVGEALHWRGKARNGAGDVVAWVVKDACTQPSGERVPYRMLLSVPASDPMSGCCR